MRELFLMFFVLSLAVGKAAEPIAGLPEADVERMYQYVSSRNPAFDREVAEAFHDLGCIYGIRGDVALCQAIIETGWFRFDNGTCVPPDAHNYCGLGVKQRGDLGCSFETVRDGVAAMMQHLYAYSTTADLPEGETMIDPRFKYVRRGCAPNWEDLSGRWAMSDDYGRKILRIYSAMMLHAVVENPEPPGAPDPSLPDSIENEIFMELQQYETKRNN
ncbi:MAG: glucosaminidase domain-containing protein [Duncaniella sp.]|nr:glucosaminidase domain-containing protein [Duncaniella sp.]